MDLTSASLLIAPVLAILITARIIIVLQNRPKRETRDTHQHTVTIKPDGTPTRENQP